MKNISIVPQQRKDFILETSTSFLGRLFSSILNIEFSYFFFNLLYFLLLCQAQQLAAQSLLSRNMVPGHGGLGGLQENVLEKYGNMLRHLHGYVHITTLTLF
jgi:hypothetical protein